MVDLSAKLTGLRTSGKHAKPQRAEFQVHGLGVTTSHRSAPATSPIRQSPLTLNPVQPPATPTTKYPQFPMTTLRFSSKQCSVQETFFFTFLGMLVYEDLQRNFNKRQTVGLVSFRDRLRPSFESILDSEHLNCLG